MNMHKMLFIARWRGGGGVDETIDRSPELKQKTPENRRGILQSK